jgi:hypothetical protein
MEEVESYAHSEQADPNSQMINCGARSLSVCPQIRLWVSQNSENQMKIETERT